MYITAVLIHTAYTQKKCLFSGAVELFEAMLRTTTTATLSDASSVQVLKR